MTTSSYEEQLLYAVQSALAQNALLVEKLIDLSHGMVHSTQKLRYLEKLLVEQKTAKDDPSPDQQGISSEAFSPKTE